MTKYEDLIRLSSKGFRFTSEEISQSLLNAGKTERDLLNDLTLKPPEIPTREIEPGKQCPKCERGQIKVSTSRRSGFYQKQYLKCDSCKSNLGSLLRHESEIRRRN